MLSFENSEQIGGERIRGICELLVVCDKEGGVLRFESVARFSFGLSTLAYKTVM